ncbi:FkbM family methyltransferase [Ectopseudomonas toyotomiensis]|uniref:FkbM family methyltransferase n=1 Tax=Ectopseudomonas toyotomiensis TaxID=554344 RepID=UPI0037C976A1
MKKSTRWFLEKFRVIISRLIGKEVLITLRPRVSVKLHKNAVTNGQSMALYADLVKKFCTFNPSNVFEIGANYAQDAEYLRKRFGLEDKDVYIFEPHPLIIREVNNMYGFNSYGVAISNYDGKAVFHAIDVENNEYKNSGISSLKEGLFTDKRNFIDTEVDVIRMDTFMQREGIESIDFLKIDVEGANFEVVEGFGEKLSKVKAVQVEGEYKEYWEGQKLYWDMALLLKKNDFELVYFSLSDDGIQSDSFWVQKQYLSGLKKHE